MSTILDKILIGVIALLIAAGTGEFVLYRHEQGRADAALLTLGTTQAALSAEQATTHALRQSNAALTDAVNAKAESLRVAQAKEAETRSQLDAAIKANAAWANADVPDAVWNSLFPRADKAGSSDQGGKDAAAR